MQIVSTPVDPLAVTRLQKAMKSKLLPDISVSTFGPTKTPMEAGMSTHQSENNGIISSFEDTEREKAKLFEHKSFDKKEKNSQVLGGMPDEN